MTKNRNKMLNYKELIQSSQGGEDKMWESVEHVCRFLDELKGTHPEKVRKFMEAEYEALVDFAIDLGITNGFIQESGTVSPSYIPVFDGTGILPAARR